MKISELIQQLEIIKEKYGDLQAVVEYRDQGGSWHGYDEELEMVIKDGKIVL